ncbi:hypothetical protein BMAJHU_I0805, partial [Burkholderia mallei JHU]
CAGASVAPNASIRIDAGRVSSCATSRASCASRAGTSRISTVFERASASTIGNDAVNSRTPGTARGSAPSCSSRRRSRVASPGSTASSPSPSPRTTRSAAARARSRNARVSVRTRVCAASSSARAAASTSAT